MKLRIACDLDSTLVHLPVVNKISDELGLSHKDSDFHDWYFSQFPPQYAIRSKELFKDIGFMCNLKPYRGVHAKLKKWKKQGNELILLTARDRGIQGKTIEMVQKLFPDIFTYIDFANPGQLKTDLFHKYSIDRWVDDNHRDVEEALKLGIKTFMISNEFTSYNHEFVFHSKNNYLLEVVQSVSSIQVI